MFMHRLYRYYVLQLQSTFVLRNVTVAFEQISNARISTYTILYHPFTYCVTYTLMFTI